MKTSGLQDHALVGCRDGYRDQIRRQGDQGTQRARDQLLPLVNITNSMGWWVREGRSLAMYKLDRGRAGGLRATANNRGQPRSNCKNILKQLHGP